MLRIQQICEELQATNGKKDKERILLEIGTPRYLPRETCAV